MSRDISTVQVLCDKVTIAANKTELKLIRWLRCHAVHHFCNLKGKILGTSKELTAPSLARRKVNRYSNDILSCIECAV